ncbi:TPA: hypothetical protein ACG31L_005145 [Escherichia coli]
MMIQIRSVSPSPEGLFNEGKAPGSEMLNHSQFSQLTVACLAEHLLKKSCMMNPLCGGATGALGVIFDTQESERAGLVAPD